MKRYLTKMCEFYHVNVHDNKISAYHAPICFGRPALDREMNIDYVSIIQ